MADRPVLDRFRLDGKVAVVTGASSGLGVAFAQALAEAGADVALGARRVDRLADTAALVERAGRTALTRGHRRGRPAVVHRPGRRWRWRSSAGSTCWSTTPASVRRCPATRETPEQFRQVIDVNLNGCYWMAQACGRVMQPGSSIINISSVLGLTTAGLPQAAYAASKAGLIGLTRDLAQQWTGRKGIRVNAIAPGLLRVRDDRPVPARLPRVPAGPDPAGRKGDPAELAAAVVFLASDAAGYITGQTLAVDGGMTIT